MASRDTGMAVPKRDLVYWMRAAFLRLGVLPFLLAVAVIVFTLMSDNFASPTHQCRPPVGHLMIVALGQMLAL
jgi:ribose transport system permease protein